MAREESTSGIALLITRIAELAQLNLLTLLCCIPVVTAGAALTAMHTILLRIRSNELGYIGKSYFQAFRDNLKKATLLWIPFLFIFFAAAVDLVIVNIDGSLIPRPLMILIFAAVAVSFLIMQYVFPLQAHFENSVPNILKMAAVLAVSYLPRTLAMAALSIFPMLALSFLPALPLVLFFGMSLPGFISVKLYGPIFTRLEENVR